MGKLAIFLALVGLPAQAQQVSTETYTLEGVQLTLHVHPFLNDEGLSMLRLVGRNRDALSLFVPGDARFAAMALAPADGLMTDGQLADTAIAVADLPDLQTARDAALKRCNAARSGGLACVIAMEIQPE